MRERTHTGKKLNGSEKVLGYIGTRTNRSLNLLKLIDKHCITKPQNGFEPLF